jgi:CRISPR type III-A-associated protein Csm2
MNNKKHGYSHGGGRGRGRDHQGARKNKNWKKGDGKKEEEKLEPEPIIFRDDDNRLRRDLLVKEAEKWAKDIAIGGVSYTQLRKFYSEALALKSKMNIEKKSFEDVEALVGMMIAKANYAKVRNAKNKMLFHFINSCVRSIEKDQDFYDFVLFYEAVLGFFPRKN